MSEQLTVPQQLIAMPLLQVKHLLKMSEDSTGDWSGPIAGVLKATPTNKTNRAECRLESFMMA